VRHERALLAAAVPAACNISLDRVFATDPQSESVGVGMGMGEGEGDSSVLPALHADVVAAQYRVGLRLGAQRDAQRQLERITRMERARSQVGNITAIAASL
jgi:hypothetical protein